MSIFPDPASLQDVDILEFDTNSLDHFIKPIVLTIGYKDERPGMNAIIETYNSSSSIWVPVTTNLRNDKVSKTVSVDISHFSYWKIGYQSIIILSSVTTEISAQNQVDYDRFYLTLNLLMLFVLFLFYLFFGMINYKSHQSRISLHTRGGNYA